MSSGVDNNATDGIVSVDSTVADATVIDAESETFVDGISLDFDNVEETCTT